MQWDLPLTDVFGAGFVSYKAHGRMIWRLDLMSGNDTRHINVNLPASDAHMDESFIAFLDLATALVAVFEEVAPDLQVGFGEHGWSRKAMFSVGVVSALAGTGILVAALMSGISTDRMAGAAVPLIGLAVLGGLLIRSNHPWKAPPKVAFGLLPQLLFYLAGGDLKSSDG